MSGHGLVERGGVRQARHGKAGRAWRGMSRFGWVRYGEARFGMAGMAWLGGPGLAMRGEARRGRRGSAWLGWV